jgi:hypothetical protein
MNTSRRTTSLSKPHGAEKIPVGTLGYVRSRNKHNAYALVIEEFQRSGLSQADLARRLGKGTDVVCRWLGAPGNWTLDTLSDLMFAISGAMPVYGRNYPLEEPDRNYRRPDWVDLGRIEAGGSLNKIKPPASATGGNLGVIVEYANP